ncbi:MAG: MaoC family dehydratase N-terminal domain-containing protein [Acidimicrobiia bacterium]
MTELASWIGSEAHARDVIAAAPLRRLAATLDIDAAFSDGDPLPPMWHWLFCLPEAPRSVLGVDGHPRRGGFLPPVPLQRRMFAGGDTRFEASLRVGDVVQRRSRVEDVVAKQGRWGPLVLVTVTHDISRRGAVAVRERQTLVYTDATPAPDEGETAPPAAVWARDVPTDPVLLFRFSALTFNSHRIHYDAAYAKEVEAYPGPVVHGPLTALLLLDLMRRHSPRRPVRFGFRALAPVFVGDTVSLRGTPGDREVGLAAYRPDGMLAVEAHVELRR